MTPKEVIAVKDAVDSEGFDYALVHYSDFVDEVKDQAFHQLRKQFLEARERLMLYCGLEDV